MLPVAEAAGYLQLDRNSIVDLNRRVLCVNLSGFGFLGGRPKCLTPPFVKLDLAVWGLGLARLENFAVASCRMLQTPFDV